MPRPIAVFIAAVAGALLVLLATASCSLGGPPPPPPLPPPPPPPASQICPDGTVIAAGDFCPSPPPPPPPPPMANGGGDHHPPPTANGGGDHRPPPPPPPVSAERNGDDDGHAAPRGGRDWRDYAHAARNGERIDPSVRPPAASLNGGTATSPVSGSPDDDAEKGFGAFRPLDDMEVDNWYTVEFFVAPSKTGLAEEAEGRELTAPSPIWVGRWMRVTLLKDPSFEIRAKTDAEKPTGRDRQASWQWDVRPLTGGERTLYAKVEVLQRNADGSFETIETRTRQVAVKVEVGTWRGFLIALKNAASLGEALSTLFAAWEKTLLALAALITALGGLLVAVRKLRGKKPARLRRK